MPRPSGESCARPPFVEPRQVASPQARGLQPSDLPDRGRTRVRPRIWALPSAPWSCVPQALGAQTCHQPGAGRRSGCSRSALVSSGARDAPRPRCGRSYPDMPKELTPAQPGPVREATRPVHHGRRDAGWAGRPSRNSGWGRRSAGAWVSRPRLTASDRLYQAGDHRRPIPGGRCWSSQKPVRQRLVRLHAPGRRHSPTASSSIGSPTAVPVPWASK